jgi:hypothetical protein
MVFDNFSSFQMKKQTFKKLLRNQDWLICFAVSLYVWRYARDTSLGTGHKSKGPKVEACYLSSLEEESTFEVQCHGVNLSHFLSAIQD